MKLILSVYQVMFNILGLCVEFNKGYIKHVGHALIGKYILFVGQTHVAPCE